MIIYFDAYNRVHSAEARGVKKNLKTKMCNDDISVEFQSSHYFNSNLKMMKLAKYASSVIEIRVQTQFDAFYGFYACL